MARNPYQPGVGTPPPYLADREGQMRRFRNYLDDYPEKRRNVRVLGLRGVGKTVLVKEYARMARQRDWVVIRRDLTPRLCNEDDFRIAIAENFEQAAKSFSGFEKLKAAVKDTRRVIGDITVSAGGVSVSGGASGAQKPMVLEDLLGDALIHLGHLARKSDRGLVLLYDEAHTVYDRPRKEQFPLSALLGAFVKAQDDDDDPLPVMLVMCGLPPLQQNLQAARSHSERLFRGEDLGNLSLAPISDSEPSKAALALIRPAEDTAIRFDPQTAETIATDMDGYPYFIQQFGEALWEAADISGNDVITDDLYLANRAQVQDELDRTFFENRYTDVPKSDQMTLRVAGALEGERFDTADLVEAFDQRGRQATQQSLNRLLKANLVYQVTQGTWAYTAPMFGDYLRRKHPRHESDH
jgi:hypothetical protein